jgi:hypothetical protein
MLIQVKYTRFLTMCALALAVGVPVPCHGMDWLRGLILGPKLARETIEEQHRLERLQVQAARTKVLFDQQKQEKHITEQHELQKFMAAPVVSLSSQLRMVAVNAGAVSGAQPPVPVDGSLASLRAALPAIHAKAQRNEQEWHAAIAQQQSRPMQIIVIPEQQLTTAQSVEHEHLPVHEEQRQIYSPPLAVATNSGTTEVRRLPSGTQPPHE